MFQDAWLTNLLQTLFSSLGFGDSWAVTKGLEVMGDALIWGA